MSKNVFNKFEKFCAALKINSKEYGVVPLIFWQTQKYYLEKIQEGIAKGIRDFKTLKGRQGGVTTVDMAIALYWMNKYAGTLGAMITDDASNLIRGRSIITQYMRSLPEGWHVGHEYHGHHNIYELELDNLSLLSYLVAGKRKKSGESGDLGQGKGLNFLIATEVASWSDSKQVDKLTDSLAERHPNRLYLWEGTANGFNHWYDMCKTAQDAVTQQFIFIGWWLKEINACPRDSNEYRVYWDGKLTGEEKEWVREIEVRYKFKIQPEQIAWWRLQLFEKKNGEVSMLYQEHPPTEEHAFIMSGMKYFSSQRLTEAYKLAEKLPFDSWRYTFGPDFKDTESIKTNAQNAQLRIWEYAVPNATYVLGADPAFGYNAESDQSVCPLYRCYADRLVQVAEFCATGVRPEQFAWIILHLVGAYRNVMVNIEINGPGQHVMTEMRNVQRNQSLLGARGETNFADVLSCMRHFFYARQDALRETFSYHTKTTHVEKEEMLGRMKALFETGRIDIRSTALLNEMKYFARTGGELGGGGGEYDDRVIGTALAVLAWARHIQPGMMNMGQTYEAVTKAEKADGEKSALDNYVFNYLKERGVEFKQ